MKISKLLPLLFFIALFSPANVFAQINSEAEKIKGRILLEVENSGRAWYLHPSTLEKYYLGRPADAFAVMRQQGIGIKNSDLEKIPLGVMASGPDTDADGLANELEDTIGTDKNLKDTDADGYEDYQEIKGGYSPLAAGQKFFLDHDFSLRQKGRIFIQAENNGEAWYVNPADAKRYYLGRPADAFAVMRKFGLGISAADWTRIFSNNSDLINLPVPFSAQAPFGEWSDPRQQDGCEEASALMAVKWARGEELSGETAKREIIAASIYQDKNFGEHRDTSAEDTMDRIVKGYFNFEKAALKDLSSAEDIISALQSGDKIMIIPVNGQKLANPYFTDLGPLNHFIVIKGYDSVRREFIVNDPGTRQGKNYRYGVDLLFSAARDYPTGYHQTSSKENKIGIVIEKLSSGA